MRIDLHTHSDRSDGTLSPAALVWAARQAGLDVVALTDHDTAVGWEEAEVAADEAGVDLVRGMEISCQHLGRSAHLLAYGVDPAHPALAAELDRVLDGRRERTPQICARLREAGIDIDEQAVAARAGHAEALGRPHIADVLVDLGVVADRDEAFERFLSPGRVGYVSRYAPALVDMVGIVGDAGGVGVLAHPWGRHGSTALQESDLRSLAESGLLGIEADHQDHTPAQRDELRTLGRRLGLVVTGASDFHGTGKVDHDLGRHTTSPEDYARLLDAIAGAQARATRVVGSAGRRTTGGEG